MNEPTFFEVKPPDFEKTGVNPDNVEAWRKLIALKNPWLERID